MPKERQTTKPLTTHKKENTRVLFDDKRIGEMSGKAACP
jgi:hypothetical protein